MKSKCEWLWEESALQGIQGLADKIDMLKEIDAYGGVDLKRVLSFPPYPGDYLHPVVYACTAVMLLCLLISIMTYIVHHSIIRISRKGWHMLLNFLFHTAMTFGVFAGGINQINYPVICQVVSPPVLFADSLA
ncbi:hypothetical protein DNTS_012269 [Danionella cerebrum]|uniref:G-protein coupled receptors family 2 profile 2 domain-containing protein n=1 Tax=Danionella cerebrum TaxID=2873325 RepID=A0A553RQR3_9TELE|nr:hypothetical protein DNTS_012269 [Danionella translucida]